MPRSLRKLVGNLNLKGEPKEGDIKPVLNNPTDTPFHAQRIYHNHMWRYHGKLVLMGSCYTRTWYFDRGVQVNGPEGWFSQSIHDGQLRTLDTVVEIGRGYTRVLKTDFQNGTKEMYYYVNGNLSGAYTGKA